MHANHQELEVAWAPSGKLVLILQEMRWDYGSLLAYRVDPATGPVGKELNVGKPLEAAFKAWLKKNFPRQYAHSRDSFVVAFFELRASGEGLAAAELGLQIGAVE